MPTPYKKMTPEQKKKRQEDKKRWALKNRDKIIRYKRKHYSDNRDKYLLIERERSYKKLYGISVSDYNKILEIQGGRCAICGTDKSIKAGRIQSFSVDHCHKTGRVRGLLCLACNHLLGRYENNKDKIHEYLNSELDINQI